MGCKKSSNFIAIKFDDTSHYKLLVLNKRISHHVDFVTTGT